MGCYVCFHPFDFSNVLIPVPTDHIPVYCYLCDSCAFGGLFVRPSWKNRLVRGNTLVHSRPASLSWFTARLCLIKSLAEIRFTVLCVMSFRWRERCARPQLSLRTLCFSSWTGAWTCDLTASAAVIKWFNSHHRKESLWFFLSFSHLRCFALIDSSTLEQTREETETEKMTHLESLVELGLSSTFSTILTQCSLDIFKVLIGVFLLILFCIRLQAHFVTACSGCFLQVALEKVFNFATTNIFETRVSGRMVADMCRAAAKVSHYWIIIFTKGRKYGKQTLLNSSIILWN